MNYIQTLFAVLTGSLVFLSNVPGVTASGPSGKTFRVRVVSSLGTRFTDCFRFDTPNTGDLTIDLLSQTITFRHGGLEPDEDTIFSKFKAVSRRSQPLSIMFFGDTEDELDLMIGQAVNEFGETFVFAGGEDTACVPGLSADATTTPYSQ